MRVAVVGAGIAGITAAYLIGQRHDVTLFERNDYVGGHTNTIEVAEDGDVVPVDTGFIVCNPRTYPLFYRLLDDWGVARRDSDMSFGYWCERSRWGYVGPGLRDFARKPSNLVNPRVLGMIREQRRFGRRALCDLQDGALGGRTLGAYLDEVDSSPFFVRSYILPLAAAVWSSPDAGMLDFPAETFIRFFANHGMLELRTRPTWQTVVGGSYAYVKAFRATFRGRVLTDTPVGSVQRDEKAVTVRGEDGTALPFDAVVLSMHADESLGLLTDATPEERDALSAWTYHRNPVQLHTDASIMPPDRRLWASWNYQRRVDTDPDAPVPITYHMNRLQGLRSKRDYFVSLNATAHVAPDRVVYAVEYTHPGYTHRSIAAQRRLRELNGSRRTFFCGSYMGYGFHEDAVASAVDVAKEFGVTL